MTQCAAFGCKNVGTHSFPKDAKRRKLWEQALRRKNWKATNASRLCSSHFKPDDYCGKSLYTGDERLSKFLKSTVVPSVLSFTKTKIISNSAKERQARTENRSQLKLFTSMETTSTCNRLEASEEILERIVHLPQNMSPNISTNEQVHPQHPIMPASPASIEYSEIEYIESDIESDVEFDSKCQDEVTTKEKIALGSSAVPDDDTLKASPPVPFEFVSTTTQMSTSKPFRADFPEKDDFMDAISNFPSMRYIDLYDSPYALKCYSNPKKSPYIDKGVSHNIVAESVELANSAKAPKSCKIPAKTCACTMKAPLPSCLPPNLSHKSTQTGGYYVTNETLQLRKDLKQTRLKLLLSNRQVDRLQDKVDELKEELVSYKKNINKNIINMVTKDMTPAAKVFTKMQYTQTAKMRKGRRFTTEERVLALSMYKSSPTGYSVLFNFFTLPSVKVIKRYWAQVQNEVETSQETKTNPERSEDISDDNDDSEDEQYDTNGDSENVNCDTSGDSENDQHDKYDSENAHHSTDIGKNKNNNDTFNSVTKSSNLYRSTRDYKTYKRVKPAEYPITKKLDCKGKGEVGVASDDNISHDPIQLVFDGHTIKKTKQEDNNNVKKLEDVAVGSGKLANNINQCVRVANTSESVRIAGENGDSLPRAVIKVRKMQKLSRITLAIPDNIKTNGNLTKIIRNIVSASHKTDNITQTPLRLVKDTERISSAKRPSVKPVTD